MATYRHLDKAPIVEAIIDFRVKLPVNFDITQFSSVKDEIAVNYPIREEIWTFEAAVKIVEKKIDEHISNNRLLGYRFKSTNGKNIVQYRENGFTFSRLYPYSDWETVLSEAKNLWSYYIDKVKIETINRLATRFINRFEIGLPIKDFSKYLTAPPVIPDGLPQGITHFLNKITLVNPEQDILANILQTMEKSSTPDKIAIILDIDVFKNKSKGFENNEIWPTFENLRILKNKIFFTSITEETARLFE